MHINSLSEYNELAKAYDIFKRDDNYPAFFSLLTAASILVGQIIQKLLTGHSTLDGKTFLLNLKTLVARKGIEI